MDIIVSILAMLTGTDDVEPVHSLPECWQNGIVNECVSQTDAGIRYMVDADDEVILIYSV